MRAACVTLALLAGVSLSAQRGAPTGAPTAAPPVPVALEPAVQAAGQLPRLHSLLVSQRGTVILERYFNGRRASSLANIKSASKSVISALVGVALERGAIRSVREPITTFFPDLVPAGSPKRAITVED